MIGLGTYAFFWQHSDRATTPLTLTDMLIKSHALKAEVFQICDYQKILSMTPAQLADIKNTAGSLGITLELGTKGVQPEHLARYLALAEALDVKIVRGMVNSPGHQPTLSEAESLLRKIVPAYAASGVTLALEPYEQLSSRDLVTLLESVGSDALGIGLDPANCVAALEHPVDVITRCAPYVKNMHIKDFAFTRRGGWVGFTLEGTELGQGLLPYEFLIKKIRPAARGINRVIEHWLTWQDTLEQTIAIENRWNEKNLEHIRRMDKEFCD